MENDSHSSEFLSPKDIYDIARGNKEGNRTAATRAFKKICKVLAESLANAITLIDGVVVIGGGISGAHNLFFPTLIDHLNGTIASRDGKEFSRLVSTFYNLEDPRSEEAFYQFSNKEILVPFSGTKISYVPERRLAVGLSRLGTSEATALGAYAFALRQL